MSVQERLSRVGHLAVALSLMVAPGSWVAAQAPPASAPGPAARTTCAGNGLLPGPASFKSVEVLPDQRLTFRLCAPNAAWVSVTSSDLADAIPFGGGLPMSRDAQGLWSVTTSVPIAPDSYRFSFSVDGVPVTDPQGTTFSLTRVGQFSTLEVPGPAGDFQTYDKSIPHGVVSVIDYWSGSLGMKRRAHVYTPPGYMHDSARYPVLYLVHGAGDSDDSWTSVGHAQYILDNLIAAGKAKPMIVVMPFGHTPERPGANMLANNDFAQDFLNDLIPYVDSQFRTIAKPAARGMAGLSMGGAHTLQYGLTHPELFHYIGIFSMGLMNADQVASYESAHAQALSQASKSMKLVYYAIGNKDFLFASAAPTRAMMDKYHIAYVFHESDGGHTWINWRRYFADFAPRLFR
ncbi:MAG TPA: alpha/beta hydrolase-fold protein [Steroidobacteraceae bacterium]|nr:alpha/beta hydrolase-fold protein [Steroidobacteraceae bacterium]